MEDKQRKYLDKVIDFLVKDTIIDHENGIISLHYLAHLFTPTNLPPLPFPSLSSPFSSSPLSLFSTYCKDTYGLTRKDIDYVWENYRNIIIDKINNSGNVNESEDKQKKYLDSVVNFLIKDTEIDYGGKVVKFHFLPVHPYAKNAIGPPFMEFSDFWSDSGMVLFSYISYMTKYCKNTYGLSDKEMDYVWYRYSNTIKDKIKNKGSVNESEDKQKKFLDKVVVFLVKDTIINHESESIILDFLPPAPFSSPSFRIPFTSLFPLLPLSFSTYCKDTYGLTDQEINYVWKKYKNTIEEMSIQESIRRILKDKIKNKGSVNESVGKLDKFLDSVVKLFLSQCEIVYGTSDKYSDYIKSDFYVKTPYSDHGCTLPYGQMNNAFYKYLRDYYGMTDKEIKSAWEIIKKELQKRIDNNGR